MHARVRVCATLVCACVRGRVELVRMHDDCPKACCAATVVGPSVSSGRFSERPLRPDENRDQRWLQLGANHVLRRALQSRAAMQRELLVLSQASDSRWLRMRSA